MSTIYNEILAAKKANKKLLAILIDPEKTELSQIDTISKKINASPATHIFVGGSTFEGIHLDELIVAFKSKTSLPIVLFPGNPSQISDQADAVLFLSLISGRNPDFLIDHQVNAVSVLKKSNLEIIATSYLLIESGSKTAVERISETKPLSKNNPDFIVQTAQGGEMLGSKLIYLEAGSGAKEAIPAAIISLVSTNIEIPLIVGGGIKSLTAIKTAFDAGADLVVIGTAFENDTNFFEN